MNTCYSPNPLGPDICTGGPAYRAVVSGFEFSEEFEDFLFEEEFNHGFGATFGCSLVDFGLDAPNYLPSGSTYFDWCPRTTFIGRE